MPGGVNVAVPAGDGQVGVYRCEVRSHQSQFLAPMTALPEAGVLLQNQSAWAMDRQDRYITAQDRAAVVVIEVKGGEGKYGQYHMSASVEYFSIKDAVGTLIYETTLFAYASRPSALVRLDPALNPSPWRLFSSSGYGSWISLVSGASEIYLARDPAALALVLAAL